MTLTKDEIKALRAYFDDTTINITKLIRNIGRVETKELESFIDKLYNQTL